MNDELLTYAQASTHLNLKLGTLYALVSQGRVPHVRLGRRLVRFRRAELDAWIRRHAVGSTADTDSAGAIDPRSPSKP